MPVANLTLVGQLLAFVEEQSVVGAARRLGLTPPAATATLGRLRDLLRDDALVRSGRGMEPTARALELVERARPHLLALSAAMAKALPFDPAIDARRFVLGCTDAMGVALLPALQAMMAAEAPRCDLVLRLADPRSLPAMLDSGETGTVAGALRDDPVASARIRVLREAPWVVLRDRRSPGIDGSLETFCARPHAVVTTTGELAGPLDRLLADQGRRRRVSLGVSSLALLPAALSGSALLAVVPDFAAPRLAALGGLTIEELPIELPPVANSLAWRGVLDRDPAETWFRQRVIAAFGAAMADA